MCAIIDVMVLRFFVRGVTLLSLPEAIKERKGGYVVTFGVGEISAAIYLATINSIYCTRNSTHTQIPVNYAM